MIALLAAGALAWDLQSPYNKEIVNKFAVTVKADVGSEQHEAVFTFTVTSSKAKGETVPVKMAWNDLTVDGNEVGESSEWSGQMDKFGQLLKMETEGDEFRRMLTPFLFAFPNRAIEEKVKFESTWLKPDQEFAPKFSAEAIGIEKAGDKELLKITSKFLEKGDQGIRADGTWWFDGSGKLTKFELDAKNWVVPMAGPELVSAKITGIAK